MLEEEVFFRNVSYVLPYQLQFFADSAADKTEEPTAKKLSDARQEGQVARSTELITASSLAALFVMLKIFVGFISNQFQKSFFKSYQNIEKVAKDDLNVNNIVSMISDAIITILQTCLPIFLSAIVVSFVVILFQVKWKISGKLLKPKFNKINPISGFKKILSKEKFVGLIFELIKIAAITLISYSTLKDQWGILYLLYDMDLMQAMLLTGNLVIDLGIKISVIFLIIGIADLIYQKLKFRKDMRMSKQEVKDEFKNSEGDPKIKSRIRAKMSEVSRQRMMQSLPEADVVITNPTHLAAAIKYDRDTSAAPVLIAKGADYLALKIKDAAKEHHIEIVENKPLARMLYYNVNVGDEIPQELYQMTAEVLAYVYGLKNNDNR